MEKKETIKAETAFEETIKRVFGEDTWKEKQLQDLYEDVLTNRDDNEQYGLYGCDTSTMTLMLYIRKLMRDNDLVPDKPIDLDNIEPFFADKENWLTPTYKERFPVSWESEPGIRLKNEYNVDGWNYKDIETADVDWIRDFTDKRDVYYPNTHYYYNQLDHYLTYLTGAIRKKKDAGDHIKCGAVIKIDLGLTSLTSE